jgi:hypothetical protein
LKDEIMGAVYKETYAKPLPAGAKIIVRKGKRLAERIDAKGKRRTAPVTVGNSGAGRLVATARTCTAKYRDSSGTVREVPTGTLAEAGAMNVRTDPKLLDVGCRRNASGSTTRGESAF